MYCTVPDRVRELVPVRHKYYLKKGSRRFLPLKVAGMHGKRLDIRLSLNDMICDVSFSLSVQRNDMVTEILEKDRTAYQVQAC